MATIYQCTYRTSRSTEFDCGEWNVRNRSRCRGCGSDIRRIEGHAILAHWRGDANYSLSDSVKEFASMPAAEKAATRAYELDNQSNLVARFIT